MNTRDTIAHNLEYAASAQSVTPAQADTMRKLATAIRDMAARHPIIVQYAEFWQSVDEANADAEALAEATFMYAYPADGSTDPENYISGLLQTHGTPKTVSHTDIRAAIHEKVRARLAASVKS